MKRPAMAELLRVAQEVRETLSERRPVVALETTIVSHGMPYPRNLETARELERIVRANGAVPVTIAVGGSQIRIGLSDAELEKLAKTRDVLKLSRADLAYALGSGRDGATTVAATMLCAQLAGIAVLATGGIGGVHRGAEATFDISADLLELARSPVAVVCAGAKALLDLAKTLEVLETLGVPVIGYGTDEFPAFWSRESGLRAPLRADTPAEIARFVRTQRELGTSSGTVVALPIERSAEIPAHEMRGYVETAIEEAAHQKISGKALTPWLLARIGELTGGRSLDANIALVKANAALAAQISVELCK